MHKLSLIIIGTVFAAMTSPAAAETQHGDFTHSAQVVRVDQTDVLRVEIQPDHEFLEGRFAVSLADVDVTVTGSARGLRVLASGETLVANRSDPIVKFDIPVSTIEDGLHTVGIAVRLAVGSESRDVGGFPIFLRVTEGRASIMSLAEWGEAHSTEDGPCKNKLCFQRPHSPTPA